MRLTYVARSFLDYRIPVFEHLLEMIQGRFTLLFSADYVPRDTKKRAKTTLREAAVGLSGEVGVGLKKNEGFANRKIRISLQKDLFRAIHHTRPDVLIGDGFFQWTAYGLLYAAAHGVPLVVCYERWFHTERNAQWFRKLYRRIAIRFVTSMCCNGRLSAEYSQTLGITADRITTGNMVADTEGIRKRTSTVSKADREALRRRIGATGLTFLVVSRLIRPKGIRELMEGWTAFSAEANEPVCLLIVGGGPEELFLRDFIRRRNLKDVCLVGPVSYSDVHRFYAASDVLVMPTLEDNWSLVVPEAMACGLPVLCSIYNGCYPEMITEGKTGWVFDPLKKRETVWALRRCLRAKQNQTLSEMGKTAQDLVDSFSPRSAAAAILRACDLAFTKSGKRYRGDGLISLRSTTIKR